MGNCITSKQQTSAANTAKRPTQNIGIDKNDLNLEIKDAQTSANNKMGRNSLQIDQKTSDQQGNPSPLLPIPQSDAGLQQRPTEGVGTAGVEVSGVAEPERGPSASYMDNYSISNNIPGEEQKRRRNQLKPKKVRADNIEEQAHIYENIIKKQRIMTPADIHANKKSLGNHFVFSLLQDQDKEEIIQKMFYCENKAEFVFQQGDQASTYFIIEKGECQVIINEEIKRTLVHGSGFGELALLYGAPRSASVKSIGKCGFWAIDRNTFKKAIADIVQREYSENRSFIEKIKFFNSMTSEQKDSIANVLITQVFKKAEVIVADGDQASSYYIIKKGRVGIFKNEKLLRELVDGETFGEQALFENSKRGATVKAIEDDTRCIALGRDTIQSVLGDKVQVILYNNLIKWAFESSEVLKNLTSVQKEKIVMNQKQRVLKKGEVCFQAGKPIEKLIFVLEGKLGLQKEESELVKKGGLFGDAWLLNKTKNQKIQRDIVAINEDVLLAEISFQQLFEITGGPIEEILQKNKESHEVKYMTQATKKESNAAYKNLKLEEMICIKKLGFGQFGNVYLVKSKTDGSYYALKCIQKAQVIEQCLEKHLLQEKKVLESVQFPLIMKFIRTFRDNNNIYFLIEYVRGMELFDVIRDIGILGLYDSQFYIASLLMCIEYLHTNSIIYRDIKPENIMIDSKGYMRLIDMGTAKFLKGKAGKTFTIIGTPHYMAPEIITGKGYTYSVDLWSVGICLYEFMCGAVPFAEDADDPYEIYDEIIKKPLAFPNYMKDRSSKAIMNQFLNKTPELRLGGSFAALKANPWFDNFDFDKLLEKQLKAPYIPMKEKLISEAEIRKCEQIGKLVIDEIKHEHTAKYKKEKAKDPNWDQEF